jgi:DNA-binding NtrC family response regulator
MVSPRRVDPDPMASAPEIFPEVFPDSVVQAMPRGNHECVLVVDDLDFMVENTRWVLERSGYRVFTARSGPEALETYLQHRGEIELVVTDIVMPGMNGPTLISLLRILRPEIRIIAMSGYAPVHPEIEALHADEKHFLGKPFTASELLCMIRVTLDEPMPRHRGNPQSGQAAPAHRPLAAHGPRQLPLRFPRNQPASA